MTKKLLFLLLTVFHFVVADAQELYSYGHRCNEFSVGDGTGPLQLPKYVVKASAGPILFIFGPHMSTDIGAEIHLFGNYTFDFSLGTKFKGMGADPGANFSGYYANVGMRRYFLRRSGFYTGASVFGVQEKHSYTAGLSSGPSTYYKRTRVTESSIAVYPVIGWHSSVFSHNRYTFDFSIGPWYEFLDYSFTNLTPYEIEEVMDGGATGMEHFGDGEPRHLMLMFWLDIGLVPGRK